MAYDDENKPSGLTFEERSELAQLWNTLKKTPEEKRRQRELESKLNV